ncbi:MAG: thioredoxin [Candidatus Bathyarchaeia archaeon]
MEEDRELEKIKQKKLEEMMKKSTHLLTGAPVEVTDETFHDVVKKNPIVVIDCWAQWCGPCRMIAPIIEELAKGYAGKILFGKLNVDENQKIPVEHQIMSIPTLLIFKDGQLVDRIVGAMPKKNLEQRLLQYLK